MAIFLSVQGRSLNEVRFEIKMCFTMSSGCNKCLLVGVIGLFNKTVTVEILYNGKLWAHSDHSNQKDSSTTYIHKSLFYFVLIYKDSSTKQKAEYNGIHRKENMTTCYYRINTIFILTKFENILFKNAVIRLQ